MTVYSPNEKGGIIDASFFVAQLGLEPRFKV